MHDLSKLSVVIVEDDAIRAEVLTQQLRTRRNTVSAVVDSAADAVDAAWRYKPSVMIMDIRLRDDSHNGTWAARLIYELFNIPSVFVTGEQELFREAQDDLTRSFGYEPVIIHKPVMSVEPIIAAIGTVLRLSQASARKPNPQRTSLFVSYCQKDTPRVDFVFSILRLWASERRVQCWIDRDVLEPGDRLSDEIHAAIARTRVAILFVSAGYKESTFIQNQELPWLREAELDGARLIPVVLGKCDYNSIPVVKDLIAINPRSCPFDSMTIAQQLMRVVQLLEKLNEWFEAPLLP